MIIENKGLFIFAGFLALMQASSLQAASLNRDTSHNYQLFATLTGGAEFSPDFSQAQNIPAQNGVFSYFDYARNNDTHSEAVFGATIGTEMDLTELWSLQMGLSYYHLPELVASGNVTQGIDLPSSNTYAYNYYITSNQLLIESKLLYNMHCYHPYFSLGLGTAWNNAHDYDVDIDPILTTFSNQFGDHTSYNFSYLVGAGVDVDITNRMRLGIGYRFNGVGKTDTGRALIDDVATTNRLHTKNNYAHEVVAQLSFDIA